MITDTARQATTQIEVHPPEPVGGGPLTKNVAVITIHGMGQQTPNDTLAGTADALVQFMKARKHIPAPHTRVGEVQLAEGVRAMCAEIDISDAEKEHKRVHFFEVYWAPLTEGKISFLGTMWFLLVSAALGAAQFILDRGKFRRWVSGRIQAYPVSPSTILALSIAAVALASLLLLYASFWFTIAYKLIALTLVAVNAISEETIRNRGYDFVRQADVLLMSFTYPAIAVAMVAFIFTKVAEALVRRQRNTRLLFPFLRNAMLALGILLLAIVIVAGTITALLIVDYGISIGPSGTRLDKFSHLIDPIADFIDRLDYSLFSWLAWLGMIADALVFVAFHLFIKEFVGDVAIYVAAHRVDRFWDTRKQIREVACTAAKAIYGAERADRSPGFAFQEIYLVAHSLGSVVAYDTLNSLIADEIAGTTKGVLARTKLLLTYGSPLDKTAYLFRSYARDLGIRLGAAAATAPLIQGYRPFRWVNIYSRADIIGAALNFYDDQDSNSAGDIQNVEDPEGFVPLLAHIEYEKHHAFRQILYEALIR
jgi:hypothetical protein